MTKQDRRLARIGRGRGDGLRREHGERRLHHRPHPDRVGRAGAGERVGGARDGGGRGHLRHEHGVRPGRRDGAQVLLAPGRVEAVDARDHLAATEAARPDRRRPPARAPCALASGATESSRSRIRASAGSVARLFQRPRIRTRHVEHAAARADVRLAHGSAPLVLIVQRTITLLRCTRQDDESGRGGSMGWQASLPASTAVRAAGPA